MTRAANKIVSAVCLLAAALAAFASTLCCAGCAPLDEATTLEKPASIIICSNGVETEYTVADSEYGAAFDLLKGTRLDVALETAVDPDMETSLKEGDCIEFVYDGPQHTEGSSTEAGTVVREYDKLLFCFTGPIAGEVALGLDGRYMSGTYSMGVAAWPY